MEIQKDFEDSSYQEPAFYSFVEAMNIPPMNEDSSSKPPEKPRSWYGDRATTSYSVQDGNLRNVTALNIASTPSVTNSPGYVLQSLPTTPALLMPTDLQILTPGYTPGPDASSWTPGTAEPEYHDVQGAVAQGWQLQQNGINCRLVFAHSISNRTRINGCHDRARKYDYLFVGKPPEQIFGYKDHHRRQAKSDLGAEFNETEFTAHHDYIRKEFQRSKKRNFFAKLLDSTRLPCASIKILPSISPVHGSGRRSPSFRPHNPYSRPPTNIYGKPVEAKKKETEPLNTITIKPTDVVKTDATDVAEAMIQLKSMEPSVIKPKTPNFAAAVPSGPNSPLPSAFDSLVQCLQNTLANREQKVASA